MVQPDRPQQRTNAKRHHFPVAVHRSPRVRQRRISIPRRISRAFATLCSRAEINSALLVALDWVKSGSEKGDCCALSAMAPGTVATCSSQLTERPRPIVRLPAEAIPRHTLEDAPCGLRFLLKLLCKLQWST
jgi:hypothetical protein